MYGPVVPAVFDSFREFENRGIKWEGEVVTLDKEEEMLFTKVMDIYGEYSAYGLMRSTHNETPWKSTPIGVGNIISKEKLREFFSSRIN